MYRMFGTSNVFLKESHWCTFLRNVSINKATTTHLSFSLTLCVLCEFPFDAFTIVQNEPLPLPSASHGYTLELNAILTADNGNLEVKNV